MSFGKALGVGESSPAILSLTEADEVHWRCTLDTAKGALHEDGSHACGLHRETVSLT